MATTTADPRSPNPSRPNPVISARRSRTESSACSKRALRRGRNHGIPAKRRRYAEESHHGPELSRRQCAPPHGNGTSARLQRSALDDLQTGIRSGLAGPPGRKGNPDRVLGSEAQPTGRPPATMPEPERA